MQYTALKPMQKTPSCRKGIFFLHGKTRAKYLQPGFLADIKSEGHARPALFPRGREAQQPACASLNIIAVIGKRHSVWDTVVNGKRYCRRHQDRTSCIPARADGLKSPRSTNLSMPPLKAGVLFRSSIISIPAAGSQGYRRHCGRGSPSITGFMFPSLSGRSLLVGPARNSIFFDSGCKTLQSAPGRTEGRTFPAMSSWMLRQSMGTISTTRSITFTRRCFRWFPTCRRSLRLLVACDTQFFLAP